MEIFSRLKSNQCIWILIMLIMLYAWSIFIQIFSLSIQLVNHWTHIIYLLTISIIMILGFIKPKAYFFIIYISLLMPLDNIFNGLRFLDFYIFYSYVGYNLVAFGMAYFAYRFIKLKGLRDKNIIKNVLLSLMIVVLCISIGVYQHHLEVSNFYDQ